MISGVALVNLIPDYISLLETRWVLSKLTEVKKTSSHILLLFSDIALTLLVQLPFLFIGMWIFSDWIIYISIANIFEVNPLEYPLEYILSIADSILMVIATALLLDDSFQFAAIFIWTTFFTSIWIWIFLLSYLLIRIGFQFRGGIRFLQYALPIQEKPLRAIGQVMGGVSCLTYWVAMVPISVLRS